MAITQIKGSNIEDGTVVAADIKDDSIINAKIKSDAAIATTKISGLAASATTDTTDASNITSGTLPTARLASVLDLSGKTVTLPAGAVTAHAVTPTLDSPVITGTLTLLPSAAVTHTIANWSDDLSYTITPTNCTVGDVNVSGQFVVTHTSGIPSYTIKATTASLGLADSALVTKNLTLTLTAPTLSSPANVGTATDVVYTITSTDSNDDKLILDPGTANFTYQSESGPGTASKVGNTVECVGFGTGNPVVTIQFTAEATYSVTAKAVKIDGTYGTSANSSADSITCQNFVGMVATGGTQLTDHGDYRIRKFVTSGVFTVTTVGTLSEVEYLVVAGGGGGASGHYAGGGGAGGMLTGTYTGITATTYTVTIGDGGATGATHQNASSGDNSVFGDGGSAITCIGGGWGGGYSGSGSTGGVGGSGGGCGAGTARTGGAGTAGPPRQGYAGGNTPAYGNGSGGGGAGEVGETPALPGANTTGGVGGDGLQSSITGTAIYYAGGGGGGSGYTSTIPAGAAAQGGGGRGGASVAATGIPTAGTDEFGGGGGGSADGGTGTNVGMKGGDGVVFVRYKFQ